ncbi:hypothetical protein B0G80_8745 [Paraburkholderia sp. BL6669N2]|nr:hypothetical protein B0G80_8745 [Paraburkholderia sp. BL6669N2]
MPRMTPGSSSIVRVLIVYVGSVDPGKGKVEATKD